MKTIDLIEIIFPIIGGLIGIGTFIWYEFSSKKRKYTLADIPKLTTVKSNYDLYIGRPNRHLGLPGSIWGNPFPYET